MGDLSPRFIAMDQEANRINLADYLGKKSVLLYFYPKDFTPDCTKEACGFQALLQDFDAENVVVIGVSFDSTASHCDFAKQYNLKFHLISDSEGRIAYAFGAKMKGTNLDQRVSFLIDPDGHIVQITDSKDPEKHFHEMQAAIVAMKRQEG